jgi:peroxiredoxin
VCSELAKALGLDKNIPALGGVRCRRFAALVESGVIKAILPEPEGNAPMKCSTSNHMMSLL